MTVDEIIDLIRPMGDPRVVEKMAYFGIKNGEALGIKIPVLKGFVKENGLQGMHELATQLFEEPYHEAKLLAIFMADPKQVDEALMDQWVDTFYSWDLVDAACAQLFVKTAFARKKLWEWVDREEEYVKRAGFVMMVAIAIHDKKATNEEFYTFFPILEREAWDDRNFVKKAINWALRQIGKRNMALNQRAVVCGEKIKEQGSKPARWIANDALRELNSDKIQERLLKKG